MTPTEAVILKELKNINIKLEILNSRLNTSTTQGGSYCVIM